MRSLSRRRILQLIFCILLIISLAWLWVDPSFNTVYTAVGAIAALVGAFVVDDTPFGAQRLPPDVTLFESECGNQAIDLADQRLNVSAAFGSYFAGLLEREQGYVLLSGQIECTARKGQEGLSPLQRIIWSLQNPQGARVYVLAADGGMGKSTLASKLVRCLFDQEAIDIILGDSAKSEHVDPVSGQIQAFTPGYSTMSGFLQSLCAQLGLPYSDEKAALLDLSLKLAGRRAVIVVDNLETVSDGDQLLKVLLHLTNRDTRAIVTTRQIVGLDRLNWQQFLIRLNAISDIKVAREFVDWHIGHYQLTHPDLAQLRNSISDNKNIQWLIDKSGGVPLLMQLLMSDIARTSWEYMQQLPIVFGSQLLDYLYQARWDDLKRRGRAGMLARDIVLWLNREQYSRRKITAEQMLKWAQETGSVSELPAALILLHERFLIVNNDLEKGSYSIFPSLSEFLKNQDQITQ